VKGNVSVYVPVDAMLVSDVVVLGTAHPAQRLVIGGSDVATINVSLHATVVLVHLVL